MESKKNRENRVEASHQKMEAIKLQLFTNENDFPYRSKPLSSFSSRPQKLEYNTPHFSFDFDKKVSPLKLDVHFVKEECPTFNSFPCQVTSTQDFIDKVIIFHKNPFCITFVHNDEAELFERVKKLPSSSNKDLLLGFCYEKGKGVEKDISKAVQYYYQSAEQGNPVAINKIGYCFYVGTPVTPKDKKKGKEYYLLAAKQLFAPSLYNLTIDVILKEDAPEKDLRKATHYLHLAVFQGYVLAKRYLGILYYKGRGVKKDLLIAEKLLYEAMTAGDDKSIFHLAFALEEDGKLDEAIEFYELGHEKGIEECTRPLADLYYDEEKNHKNYQRAFSLYQEIPFKSAAVLYNMAMILLSGEVGKDSSGKAFRYLEKASEKEYPPALFTFGYSIFKTTKSAKEIELAISMIQKAADKKNIDALMFMAVVYEVGEVPGFAKDEEKAMQLYMQVADSTSKNAPKACRSLGKYYFKKHEFKKAREFYNRAIEGGEAKANYDLALLMMFDEKDRANFPLVLSLLKKAKEAGMIEAEYEIAVLFFYPYPGLSLNEAYAISIFESLEEKGFAVASYKLGYAYEKGKGVEKDDQKAMLHYKIAQERGYYDASARMAILYASGALGKKDLPSAISIVKEGMKKKSGFAFYVYGYFVEQGYVVDEEKDAISIYKEGEENNSVRCILALAQRFKEKDPKQAFIRAQALSKIFPVQKEAIFLLGQYYQEGVGTSSNMDYAIKIFQRVAEPTAFYNYMPAQKKLALLYYQGKEVKKNPLKAFYYFSLASDNKDGESTWYLARCYENGVGLSPQLNKAFQNYVKAYKLGYTPALTDIGNCYFDGKGVEQNYIEAVRYYKLAADSGDINALYDLAEAYESGKGVEVNIQKALEFYKEAANKKHALAEYRLASMYEQGKGVEKDLEKASILYQDSMTNGYALAQEDYERVEKKLSLLKLAEVGVERSHVFISWNHYSEAFSLQVENILKEGGLKVWHSNAKCEGFIDEACLLAIQNARIFLIILSEKALESTYVRMEVEAVYKRVKEGEIDISCLKAMYDGDERKIKEKISSFPKDNIFHIFVDLDISPLYVTLPNIMLDNIYNSLGTGAFKAYRLARHKRTDSFSLFILSSLQVDRSLNMVNATVKMEQNYVLRPLYDLKDKNHEVAYGENELLKNEVSFIIAPGGRGKSIYLQNFEHTCFKVNQASMIFFRFSSTELMRFILENEKEEKNAQLFIRFLKDDVFKRELDELYQDAPLSNEKFTQLFFQANKQIYFLIDALDELGPQRKEMISIFFRMWNDLILHYNQNHTLHFIFTSRGNEELAFQENFEIHRYELPPFNEEEEKKLFEQIMIIFNQSSLLLMKKEEKRTFSYEEDYPSFEECVRKLNHEIRYNPLLLNHFMILYFMNALEDRPMPQTEYEIMMQSINLLVDFLEKEKKMDEGFEDASFLMHHLLDILCYLDFALLSGDNRKLEEILLDYLLEEKERERVLSSLGEKELYALATRIKNHLISRNFASENKITHAIFASYFAASYVYDDLFSMIGKGKMKHIVLKEKKENEMNLDYYMEHYFSLGEVWGEIFLILMQKLLFEMSKLPHEESLSNEHSALLKLILMKAKDYKMTAALFTKLNQMAKKKNVYFYKDVQKMLREIRKEDK